jgi:hypothetical protein
MSTIAKKIQLASAGAGGGDGPAALFEIDVPNSYSTFLQWDEANQQYIGSNRSNYHLKQFYGFDIEGNQTFSWEVNTGYNQYSEWNSNHSIFREDGYQSGVGAFISGSIELVSGAGRPSMVVSAQDSSATGGWDTNSFVGAIRVNVGPQYGTHFYAKGNTASSGYVGNSNAGGILQPSFGSGSGSNSATAYYHFGRPGQTVTNDKAVWSGSSRDYPICCVGSYYANTYWAASMGNNPGQYNKGIICIERQGSNSLSHGTMTGKTTSNSSHYISGLYADPRYSIRALSYLVDVTDSSSGKTNITSWDASGNIRDQICLSLQSGNSNAPRVAAMFHDASFGSNDVYIFLGDPSDNYTYYIIHWQKADDLSGVSGGANANNGGTWNVNGTAKKLVFDSSWKANTYHGMGTPGWGEVITSPIDGDTEVLSWCNNGFSIGGKPVIFNIPKDLTQLSDQVVSGVVTITSGSSVNTEVANYLDSGSAVSWGSNISRSDRGTGGQALTGNSIRSYTSTSTILNTEYI